MKMLLTLAGITGFMLVAGCAPAPLTKADVDGRIVCDSDYMDQVERQAKRQMKTLKWVNCPHAILRVS